MSYDPTKLSSASFATAIASYITSASVATALATYVTSASAATALATYITSSSVATALSPYITSSSVATALAPYLTSASAALSTYLTSGSFATAIATYLTSASAASRALGGVSVTGASTLIVTSGVWTDCHSLNIYYYGKGAATTTNAIIHLYTDGGTTPFLTLTCPTFSATASDVAIMATVIGANTRSGLKALALQTYRVAGVTTQPAVGTTATANAGTINAVGIALATGATTRTQSSAFAYVRGWI